MVLGTISGVFVKVLTKVGPGVLDGHVDLLKRKIETDGDGAEE